MFQKFWKVMGFCITLNLCFKVIAQLYTYTLFISLYTKQERFSVKHVDIYHIFSFYYCMKQKKPSILWRETWHMVKSKWITMLKRTVAWHPFHVLWTLSEKSTHLNLPNSDLLCIKTFSRLSLVKTANYVIKGKWKYSPTTLHPCN